MTPSSGSTSTANYQFLVSHGAGYSSLGYVEVVINSSLAAAQGCYLRYYLRYERAANRLYLLNDTASAFIGPVTPDAAGALANSQCSVNVAGSSVVGSGNTLTLSAR